MKASDLDFLIAFIQGHTGISLDASKSYLLESRLRSVLRKQEMETLSDLVQKLRGPETRALLPLIVDAMTTNETSFFRDSLPFEHLAEEVLPGIIARRTPLRKLRLWSAASSSGQEAVTLAIVLLERFPELKTWDVKILASDVSPAMVERVKQLEFTEVELGRGMPADLSARYFDRTEARWRAKPIIRNLIEARQINLIEPLPSVGTQDLILMRNVLIYFDESTRNQIFAGIQRVLAPDGFLVLGTAEKPRDAGYERAFGAHVNVFRRAA